MNEIGGPTIRALAPDEWPTYKRLRLAALTESPDAFGRTLGEEETRADAAWRQRLASTAGYRTDVAFVGELNGELVGLAWGRIEESRPDAASLYQMWVAPSARRRAAGRALLDAVVTWASRAGASVLELGVTCGTPAMRLYESAGFECAGDPAPLRPGSPIMAQPMRLSLTRAS